MDLLAPAPANSGARSCLHLQVCNSAQVEPGQIFRPMEWDRIWRANDPPFKTWSAYPPPTPKLPRPLHFFPCPPTLAPLRTAIPCSVAHSILHWHQWGDTGLPSCAPIFHTAATCFSRGWEIPWNVLSTFSSNAHPLERIGWIFSLPMSRECGLEYFLEHHAICAKVPCSGSLQKTAQCGKGEERWKSQKQKILSRSIQLHYMAMWLLLFSSFCLIDSAMLNKS